MRNEIDLNYMNHMIEGLTSRESYPLLCDLNTIHAWWEGSAESGLDDGRGNE